MLYFLSLFNLLGIGNHQKLLSCCSNSSGSDPTKALKKKTLLCYKVKRWCSEEDYTLYFVCVLLQKVGHEQSLYYSKSLKLGQYFGVVSF